MAESYWLTLQPSVAMAKRIRLTSQRLQDQAAAQDFVAAVKDTGLTGGNRGTRAVENNLGAALGAEPHGGGETRMAIANPDLSREFRRQVADEAHLVRDQAARRQAVERRHLDGARGSVDCAHVERLSGGDAEAAPLSDGEAMDPLMAAEDRAVFAHDGSGAERRRCRTLDEAAVVAFGHEADLLAFRLVGVDETERSGARADLAFAQSAERKERPAE